MLSYVGSDRPSIPVPLMPVDTAFERSTTSGTFVDLFTASFRKANAFIEVACLARCSDGTTSGELQVVNHVGDPLPVFFASQTPVVIPVGTTANAAFLTQQLFSPGTEVHEAIIVTVQARRAAGAGSVIIRNPPLRGA